MTEPSDAKTEPRAKKQVDLTDAYERAAHHIVPKSFFPYFAAFFVVLCGFMAFILFMVGKVFGGLLFSCVVLIGCYAFWNQFRAWRADRRTGRDRPSYDFPSNLNGG